MTDAHDGPSGPPTDVSDADPQPWWDDPSLPWRHAPTRADLTCLSLLGAVAVYGLAMVPLRPLLLVHAPQVLAALGSRTGLVMQGALAAVGDPHGWWVLLVAGLGAMKFDWIMWWAGRLWGRNIMDTWTQGKSPRAQRRYERTWELAHRFETLAIAVAFLPLPLPAGVIFASLGAAGTSLRKVLTVGTIAGFLTSAFYLYLGFAIGEPAVKLVDTYAQWISWSSVALLVGVVAVSMWRQRRQAPDAA